MARSYLFSYYSPDGASGWRGRRVRLRIANGRAAQEDSASGCNYPFPQCFDGLSGQGQVSADRQCDSVRGSARGAPTARCAGKDPEHFEFAERAPHASHGEAGAFRDCGLCWVSNAGGISKPCAAPSTFLSVGSAILCRPAHFIAGLLMPQLPAEAARTSRLEGARPVGSLPRWSHGHAGDTGHACR